MASVLHGSARTTPRLRAEFQTSKESTRTLAARYGVNPKTVAKWRGRKTTCDAPMGPKTPKSTVLTPAEEAIVVAFRQKTLLPLDDVLGCLMDTIPNLSRSALHRCLQRHGISRLPAGETTEKRKRFKTYEIGYGHVWDGPTRTGETRPTFQFQGWSPAALRRQTARSWKANMPGISLVSATGLSRKAM